MWFTPQNFGGVERRTVHTIYIIFCSRFCLKFKYACNNKYLGGNFCQRSCLRSGAIGCPIILQLGQLLDVLKLTNPTPSCGYRRCKWLA